MYHPLRGFHPPSGKAVETTLTGSLTLRLMPLDGPLVARHPCGRAADAQLSIQLLYTLPQLGYHRQQRLTARTLQVYFSFHLSLMTSLPPATLGVLRFIPLSLNSYPLKTAYIIFLERAIYPPPSPSRVGRWCTTETMCRRCASPLTPDERRLALPDLRVGAVLGGQGPSLQPARTRDPSSPPAPRVHRGCGAGQVRRL